MLSLLAWFLLDHDEDSRPCEEAMVPQMEDLASSPVQGLPHRCIPVTEP